MPSGGKFISVYANFSLVQALIYMKGTRIDHGLAICDVLRFQRDLDKTTEDICDFVDTVISNEIENEQSLQSDSI